MKKEKQNLKKKEKGAVPAKPEGEQGEEIPVDKAQPAVNEAAAEQPQTDVIEVEKEKGEVKKESGEEEKKAEEEEEEPMVVDCDLLFIMDCTGSMSSYINMCRTQLFLVVEQVKKQFEKSTLKIGFVGYRDFGDSNQFDIYPFTTEYDKLKNFINGVSASGGNDTAEDVAGAFQKALEMGKQQDGRREGRKEVKERKEDGNNQPPNFETLLNQASTQSI